MGWTALLKLMNGLNFFTKRKNRRNPPCNPQKKSRKKKRYLHLKNRIKRYKNRNLPQKENRQKSLKNSPLQNDIYQLSNHRCRNQNRKSHLNLNGVQVSGRYPNRQKNLLLSKNPLMRSQR